MFLSYIFILFCWCFPLELCARPRKMWQTFVVIPFVGFFNGCCCHIYALKLRPWFLFFSLFFFEIVCQAHVGVTICLLLLFFYCSCSSYGIAVIIHIGYFVVFLWNCVPGPGGCDKTETANCPRFLQRNCPNWQKDRVATSPLLKSLE